MIVGIEGEIELKEPTLLHINVNGLIYEVNISLNTSNSIDKKRVKLATTQIIREDSHSLYGFYSKDEKKMFDSLLKVNGVGPKVALAVCSTFTPIDFSNIIASKDINALKKVPGIGAKGANRILIELSDFRVDDLSDSSSISKQEAILALETLGFKKDAILKALANEEGDTATLVKKALKRLQRL